MQTKKAQQKIVAPTKAATKSADDEDEDTKINHKPRRSKGFLAQRRKSNNDCIVFLAKNETADITALTIKNRGAIVLGGANMHLQLNKWAYDKYFANAIIDEETEKYLEYQDLVRMEKYQDTWTTSI